MGAAGEKHAETEGDMMDTSETVAGRRGRAPAQGALDSEIPIQTLQRRCRVGDSHLAFNAEEEVVKKHAQ